MDRPASGFQEPVLTVTDALGQTHQASLTIHVGAPHEADALFRSLWQGMNDALAAGDKAAALANLSTNARRKYGPVFDALLPHMPEIVASYSPLVRILVSEGYAEYAVQRSSSGAARVYFVNFVQDVDGVWRIGGM